MPNAQKAEKVDSLKARIEGADALLLTEYRGLTVPEISELRRSLREGGASFAVVKNTLMRRAVADAGIAELEVLFEGPSAVAFVEGDPVAAAKKVTAAAKQFPALVLKGGYMDGKVLSADEAKALASLESRDVMLSKIAGLLKSDLTKAATILVAAQSKFLSLLEAYKSKLPPEATPEPEEPPAAESTQPPEAEGAEADDLSGATQSDAPAESLAPASEEASAPAPASEEAPAPGATEGDE
jgi:large subunit ribosomal protein L10